MEGSRHEPPFTSGADCFTAGCKKDAEFIQYFEHRPAVYSCREHETNEASATYRLDNIPCHAEHCANQAIYRLQVQVAEGEISNIWLCSSCVCISDNTYEGHQIVRINRPIRRTKEVELFETETLASQTEVLSRLGAADSTPTIDLSNPMFAPLTQSPDTPLQQPAAAWTGPPRVTSESSGNESPLGSRSTGRNEPPEVGQAAKRARTVAANAMDTDIGPLVNKEANIVQGLSPMVSEVGSTPPSYLPAIPSSSQPEQKRTTVSFADAAKGKRKEREEAAITDTSPMSDQYCEVNERDLQLRVPPVTDAPYSFWIDLDDTPVDHTALLQYADNHPLIKGLTYRPTGNWVEFYTRTAEDRNTLLKATHNVKGADLIPIEARKIAGSRVFLQMANVNPCADDEEIRVATRIFLKPYGRVEKMAPVLCKNSNLTTRRWNIILIVPDGWRLYMQPVAKILGIETLFYWKGQPSVCQYCLIKGHWSSQCNSDTRAQSFIRKQNRLPIIQPESPQPTPTEQTQPTTQPAAQTQPTQQPTEQPTAPKASTSASTSTTAPPQTTPATPGRGKQGFRFLEPTERRDSVRPRTETRLKEALQRSRKINVATGFDSETTGSEQADNEEDDEGFITPKTKSQKLKEKKEQEQAEQGTKRTTADRSPMATQGQSKKAKQSNRARTKGTLPDYILYCLCRGYIKDVETAMEQIVQITPHNFINTVKPSMSPAKYKNFTNWLDRREKTDKDDSVKALEESWKVPVPNILKPGNPEFVDTSAPLDKGKKKETAGRAGKSSTNPSSDTEQGKKQPQPRFNVSISYQNVEDKTITFPYQIKQNQTITNLRKALERKIRNQAFQIMLKGNENPLQNDQTATEAGISDKAEISLTDMSWNEDDFVTVRIQQPGSAKIWTRKFRKTYSARTVVRQLAEDLHLQNSNLFISRGNGVALNTTVTVDNLNLRDGEILFADHIDGFQVNANWMINAEKQQKPIWVGSQWTVEQVHRAIAATFGLQFRFRLLSTQGALDIGHNIAHQLGAKEPLKQLDLFLIQPSGSGWVVDWDTPVEQTPAEYIVRVNTTYEHDPEMVELVDTTGDLTIMDLLQTMYAHNNGLLARVLMDKNKIAYRPEDRFIDIACPDEPLVVGLTDVQYTKEAIRNAADKVALLQETQAADLLEHKYTFYNQL